MVKLVTRYADDRQRGGAGNVVASPRVGATGRRGSQDVVPEAALVEHKGHENYHMGVRIPSHNYIITRVLGREGADEM
jgi:uncharacterized protein DUF3602